MRWSDRDATFLVTCEDDLPTWTFLGHGFVGADLVIGGAGAEEFRRVRGRDVPGGLDGSYVVLAAQDDGSWLLSTDHKGFNHVYHWSDRSHWAVSNSWSALVRHLRARGTRLEPNLGSLSAWTSAPGVVRALMSFETGIVGVRLLPSTARLRLRPGPFPSLTVEPYETFPPTVGDYDSALARWLDTWAARFRTLATDERLVINIHLTGGRDSRTVVALALASLQDLDLAHHGYWLSSNAERDEFEVARDVATSLGMALNDGPNRPGGKSPSTAQQFLAWEEWMLGGYGHTMFPGTQTPWVVTAAGVGGEAHRFSYRPGLDQPSIDLVAERLRHRFRSDDAFEQWQSSMVDADRWLRIQPHAHHNPLVRNHRELRDRFHTGKVTAWSTRATALGGRDLVECSNHAADEPFKQGQVLYDIMHVVGKQDMATMPYEDPDRMPTAEQLARVPDFDWAPPTSGGRVFMADDQPDATVVPGAAVPDRPPPAVETPLGHLLAEVRRAAANPDVRGLLGDGVVDDAIATLEDRAAHGRQNLHGNGRWAHATHLAHFAFTACA